MNVVDILEECVAGVRAAFSRQRPFTHWADAQELADAIVDALIGLPSIDHTVEYAPFGPARLAVG